MKSKSIIAIAGTLIIGFTIGFIISAQVTQKKIEDMVKLGMEEGFKHKVYQLIDPTEDQIRLLDPIVIKYAEQNAQLTREFGMELKDQFKEFRAEVNPILTENQKERIKEINKRRREVAEKGHFDVKYHKHGFGHGHGKGYMFMMPEKLIEELELNENQIEEFENIQHRFMKGMRKLRHSEIPAEEWKIRRDSLIDVHTHDLKELLTDSQFEKFEQLQKEMKRHPHHDKRGRN